MGSLNNGRLPVLVLIIISLFQVYCDARLLTGDHKRSLYSDDVSYGQIFGKLNGHGGKDEGGMDYNGGLSGRVGEAGSEYLSGWGIGGDGEGGQGWGPWSSGDPDFGGHHGCSDCGSGEGDGQGWGPWGSGDPDFGGHHGCSNCGTGEGGGHGWGNDVSGSEGEEGWGSGWDDGWGSRGSGSGDDQGWGMSGGCQGRSCEGSGGYGEGGGGGGGGGGWGGHGLNRVKISHGRSEEDREMVAMAPTSE